MPLGEGPWCLRCGNPGLAEGSTFAAGYSIGKCQGPGRGKPGCGRVALTHDPNTARAVQVARAHVLATRQHFRHRLGGPISSNCDHCLALSWARPFTPSGTMTAGA